MTTELRSIILDTTRRLFSKFVSADDLSNATKGVWSQHLWMRLEEHGFTQVDEEGLTYADGLALLQTAGYYAVPLPLAESILSSKILSDLKLEKPAGVVTLAVTTVGEITFDPGSENIPFKNSHSGDIFFAGGVRISGRWRDVPWARAADAVIICAPISGKKSVLAIVEKSDFDVEEHNSLASEPLDVITLHDVPLRSFAVVKESIEDLLVHAALTRTMLSVGALERVLDMTIQYAGERNQFGRAIGKFQAVQQQIAQMAAETAAFRAIANRALQTVELANDSLGCELSIVHQIDEDEASVNGKTVETNSEQVSQGNAKEASAVSEVRRITALAKVRLAQAALVSPTNAHQIHGAMGFTQEYTLHHYTRRIWNYRHEYGNERFWGNVLLSMMRDEDTWRFITK
ncbi:acyl-CoA dehydrogenase family protein [Alicyclobacillus dauci]|uniref:Acyl-CoA/acyl-ACP dehydrogenase n=1 Tax=Alicyclobacillus dauci TaxID=1475485 RepID=A0ABY6Z100_9BACL|nr:acyl-CoA dehydrogenase family protein [Alicyclobacillus dauci]WAH36213.1 acyl-CoA/acyl-ACP dehydrogenase [Alicyclobacillus dauci]